MKTKTTQIRKGPPRIILVLLAAILVSSAPGIKAQSGGDDPVKPGSRTVLITGANRGIGLELARQYSAAGWQVIGTARKPESAEELGAIGTVVQ
ncbi:SDR family NAD(P)-dependent oxidoreductase, partial [Pseudomonadota bacterium]